MKICWCLHCERVYLEGEHRKVKSRFGNLSMCPYEGCDGDTVLDRFSWNSVRQSHPEYPKTPEKGVCYPPY